MVEREASVLIDAQFEHSQVAVHLPELEGAKVLDIGGFADNLYFRQVVSSDTSVLSINLPDEPYGRRPHVFGDGRTLPFQNDAFTYTTAIETVEHVPFPYRQRFFSEMLRVASDTAIVCTPFDSAANVKLEYDLVKQMEAAGLPPKKSTLKHRLLGLPTLSDLVEIGRALRAPFAIHPSTDAATLFQSMSDQVIALTKVSGEESLNVAREIAGRAEQMLMQTSQPAWEEAYRAIMVLRKNQQGNLLVDEKKLFLSRNELMAYQAAFRQAGWRNISDEEVFRFYLENPLRGRNIVVEGPEGVGKTSLVRELVKRLQGWGYDIAIQTDHGLRQKIREIEKQMKRVISDPERAEFFAFAMLEAAVAGNAYSLLGPCKLSINDRGIESVRMHHGLHCPDNVTIPLLLEKSNPLRIPPDLTIMLWVPDERHNFYLMQKDGDLVNRTKGPEALVFQRQFYRDLALRGGSQFTGRVVWIENPGIEGTFESVIQQALDAVESYCKIPTPNLVDKK